MLLCNLQRSRYVHIRCEAYSLDGLTRKCLHETWQQSCKSGTNGTNIRHSLLHPCLLLTMHGSVATSTRLLTIAATETAGGSQATIEHSGHLAYLSDRYLLIIYCDIQVCHSAFVSQKAATGKCWCMPQCLKHTGCEHPCRSGDVIMHVHAQWHACVLLHLSHLELQCSHRRVRTQNTVSAMMCLAITVELKLAARAHRGQACNSATLSSLCLNKLAQECGGVLLILCCSDELPVLLPELLLPQKGLHFIKLLFI